MSIDKYTFPQVVAPWMDAAKPTPEQVSKLIHDWATYGIRADMLLRTQAAKIEALTQELADAKQASRYETDVASQAITDFEEAKGKIEELEKASKWQTIDTAPNGKVLLGFVPHSMGGYLCPIDRNIRGEWINTSCIDLSTVKPTYWKPALYPPFNKSIAGEAT
mgnify:CR=1 FL=1